MKQQLQSIKEALATSKTIIISAACEVWYHGKVESHLEDGDRLIIIKSDRTLLVHQPTGVNPINYMKEGTEHSVYEEKDGVYLKSRNVFQKDYLDIRFEKIYAVSAYAFEDGHKIHISGSEEDMSDMIYEHPESIEKGFKPFSREEHTQFGFIDVFGTDKKGKMVVIECKRDFADFKAVNQLHRYIQKIAQSKGVPEKDMRGIIAAPKISENALQMLSDYGYEFVKVMPPKYLERYDKKQMRLGSF